MPPTNKTRSRHLQLLALAGAGTTIAQAAYENPFIGQQFLINDQTFEPYEFAPNKSAEILAKTPSMEANCAIHGYNIFASDLSQQAATELIEGWQITIELTTDISLEGADPLFPVEDISDAVEDNSNDEDDGGEDFCEDDEDNNGLGDLQNTVFDAVLISLLPPSNLISTETEPSLNNSTRINSTIVNKGSGGTAGSTGWTVCAAVWVTGLSMDDTATTSLDSLVPASSSSQDTSSNNSSSCAGLVSDQCIADMMAEFNSAPGGNCKNRTLPNTCQAAFVGHVDASDVVNLAQTLEGMSGAMFPLNTPIFAASTYPRSAKENNTAGTKAVNEWIFPIVMSWTPPGGGATQSHLSCVGINKALEAAAPPVTPGDRPSPAVVSSGAGSYYRVGAWCVLALVGGAMSTLGLL